MAGRELLTSQKNKIFELIERNRFDPREFAWDIESGEWSGTHAAVPVLLHTPTSFSCAFSSHPMSRTSPMWHPAYEGQFMLRVAPGVNHSQELIQTIPGFSTVLLHVDAWLERIHEESGPDLWQQLDAQRRLIGEVVEQDPDNAPFSATELPRVAASLREIGHLAEALRLTGEEVKRLGAGLTYLEQAASRMGRKDWFLLAVTLLTWAVPPEKAMQLAQGVFQVLQWLGHVQPLLPR